MAIQDHIHVWVQSPGNRRFEHCDYGGCTAGRMSRAWLELFPSLSYNSESAKLKTEQNQASSISTPSTTEQNDEN